MEGLNRFFVVAILLICSCAQQRSPSGGPRDTESPKVLAAEPLPMSTGFDAERIEIVFDEYVRLEGVNDQVLISPPLEQEPEISLKNGKRLIIDFGEQPLQEQTTYTINLGEAVVDNNEGNVLEENVYLFSTGSFIDSLQLTGSLLMAKYNEPCAYCYALLFPNVHDSLIIGERPLYVAKSDENGDYFLSNLAAGSYKLLALQDKNADLRIDENELMAFSDSLVEPVVTDSIGHRLRLSRSFADEARLSFSEWALDGSYLTVAFTGADSLPEFSGTALDNLLFTEELSLEKDSIRMWFSPLLEEDAELIYTLDGTKDTLTLGRVVAREDLKIQMAASLRHQDTTAVLQLSSPIASIDTGLIELFKDSIPLPYGLIADLPSLSIEMVSEWEPGNYRIEILPETFIDIYGMSNDSISSPIQCPSPEEFGILTLNLDFNEPGRYYAELMNRKNEVVRHTGCSDDHTWQLDYLVPDTYSLRVYNDLDNNAQWDPASFDDKVQAEPVFMLKEPITVRSNWELEQDIAIDFKP